MEIKINRKELLESVSKAKIIASGKHNLAILSSALLTAKDNILMISATNLEIAFRGIYPAKITMQGSIVAPIKILYDFVRKSKSQEISIVEKEPQWTNISDGFSSLNFVCFLVDDFPVIPEIKEISQFSIDPFAFKEMIEITTIISDGDGGKIYKKGVYFQTIKNNLRAVSTNSAQLVQIDKEIINNSETKLDGILVPKKELEKLNSIFLKESKQKAYNDGGFSLVEKPKNVILLSVDQNYLVVKKQNESILIRLLEGEFPDYKNLIKGTESNIIVDRKELMEVMKKMATMQNKNYNGSTVNIKSTSMIITFTNPDIGEMTEKIKIEYDGTPIEPAFNLNFFISSLQLMKSNKVKLNIKDAESPCVITGDRDKGIINVIMPMRI